MYLFIILQTAQILLADTDSSNPAKLSRPCGLSENMNCLANGEVADADIINANFEALDNRINDLTEQDLHLFSHLYMHNYDPYIRTSTNDRYLIISGGNGFKESGGVIVARGSKNSYNPHGLDFLTGGHTSMLIVSNGNVELFGHQIMHHPDPYIRTSSNDKQLVLSGGTGWAHTGGVIVLRGSNEKHNTHGLDFWAGGKISMELHKNQNVMFNGHQIMNNIDPYIRTSSNDRRIVISGGVGWTPTGGIIVVRGANDPMNPHGIDMYAGNKPALVIYKDTSAHFGGSVTAQNFIKASDKRFKKDIKPLKDSLSKALSLKPVSFYYKAEEFKEKGFSTKKQIGLIANDAEQVIPESIHTDREGFKHIDYDTLTPVLIGSIQELNRKITTLKNENNSLKKSNDFYAKKIAWLEREILNISQKIN